MYFLKTTYSVLPATCLLYITLIFIKNLQKNPKSELWFWFLHDINLIFHADLVFFLQILILKNLKHAEKFKGSTHSFLYLST